MVFDPGGVCGRILRRGRTHRSRRTHRSEALWASYKMSNPPERGPLGLVQNVEPTGARPSGPRTKCRTHRSEALWASYKIGRAGGSPAVGKQEGGDPPHQLSDPPQTVHHRPPEAQRASTNGPRPPAVARRASADGRGACVLADGGARKRSGTVWDGSKPRP